MSGYKTTVRSVEVTIVPRITPHVSNVRISHEGEGFGRMDGFPGGQGRWESICFGAERGEAMCSFEFHATAAHVAAARGRPVPPPRKLMVGFIQNILSAERQAVYARPSEAPGAQEVFRVERDGSRVGGGLLDCGTKAPPWFQGELEDLFQKGPAALHASVRAFDNPRWTIPAALSTKQQGDGTLTRVTIKDTFRLYAVAWDGVDYFPIASVRWGTDVSFTAIPGIRTPGRAPAGSLSGRLIWAETWSSAAGQTPIRSGTPVNQVLIDKFVEI